MESATLKIGTAQRELARQYLQIQLSRAASEQREANRKSAVAKSDNDGADRLRSDVDAARTSALQQGEALVQVHRQHWVKPPNASQPQTDYFISYVVVGICPAIKAPAVDAKGLVDPQHTQNQSLQVAKEALAEMEAALRELRRLESGAARLRLLWASISVAVAAGLLAYFWGSKPAFLSALCLLQRPYRPSESIMESSSWIALWRLPPGSVPKIRRSHGTACHEVISAV